MRYFVLFSFVLFALFACNERGAQRSDMRFVCDVMNGYTPVKDQGRSETCWIFAMLSTIETEHIGRGDSVHLSPYFVERRLLERGAVSGYFAGGCERLSLRGTGMMLVNAIGTFGILPYDSYREGREANVGVVARKVAVTASRAAGVATGLRECERRVGGILDGAFGPAPHNIYMYSVEYSPQEFARSVCAPGEYEAVTSFSHHAFYECFDLEVADNRDHDLYLNLPIDSLLRRVELAVSHGHGVCWEGDTSERGFSFERGVAVLPDGTDTGQDCRQRAFERFATTDDHCMAVVGLAHDKAGRRYFVMKNSWGTDNPYGGLMYMSFDYFKLKTVAVFLPKEA